MAPTVAISVPQEEGMHRVHPSALHEKPDNPRRITDESLSRLIADLEHDPQMLNARPIICDPTGEVVCGNMRLRAATESGWTEVPVYVHFFKDDGEKMEWLTRDNEEYGDWVPDQLAAMIHQHQQQGFDTSHLGFNDDAIQEMLRRATGDAIVPEPSEQPKQQLASEAYVEIRCSKAALDHIMATLEDWQASLDDLEISVSQ